MTDETVGYYSEYRPTLAERAWRWLGFRHAYRLRPDETEEFPSYIVTNTTIHLSILDRLRVLVSGKVEIEAITQTSVEVPHARTAVAVAVARP